jgi:glycerophosphoryl diester phosphodiesterase
MIWQEGKTDMALKTDRIGRKLAKTAAAITVLLVLASCRSPEKITAPAGAENQTGSFLMIGHRGAAGLAPENTLAGFKRAGEIGVDGRH